MNGELIETMRDPAERLARRIRDILGPYNDDEESLQVLVSSLVLKLDDMQAAASACGRVGNMDKIRAAFEQWWDSADDITNSGPWAHDTPIQFAWEAWQAAIPDPCEWLQDEWDNSYDTSCGNKYEIIDGTPEHNGMKFCTYCGGKLEAITSDATRAETRRKHE